MSTFTPFAGAAEWRVWELAETGGSIPWSQGTTLPFSADDAVDYITQPRVEAISEDLVIQHDGLYSVTAFGALDLAQDSHIGQLLCEVTLASTGATGLFDFVSNLFGVASTQAQPDAGISGPLATYWSVAGVVPLSATTQLSVRLTPWPVELNPASLPTVRYSILVVARLG